MTHALDRLRQRWLPTATADDVKLLAEEVRQGRSTVARTFDNGCVIHLVRHPALAARIPVVVAPVGLIKTVLPPFVSPDIKRQVRHDGKHARRRRSR